MVWRRSPASEGQQPASSDVAKDKTTTTNARHVRNCRTRTLNFSASTAVVCHDPQ